jgi:hypothetical protein
MSHVVAVFSKTSLPTLLAYWNFPCFTEEPQNADFLILSNSYVIGYNIYRRITVLLTSFHKIHSDFLCSSSDNSNHSYSHIK